MNRIILPTFFAKARARGDFSRDTEHYNTQIYRRPFCSTMFLFLLKQAPQIESEGSTIGFKFGDDDSPTNDR